MRAPAHQRPPLLQQQQRRCQLSTVAALRLRLRWGYTGAAPADALPRAPAVAQALDLAEGWTPGTQLASSAYISTGATQETASAT